MKKNYYFNQFYTTNNTDRNKIIVFVDSISGREFSTDDPFFYIKKDHGYYFVYAYLNDGNTKIVYDKLFFNEESVYEFHDHISNLIL